MEKRYKLTVAVLTMNRSQQLSEAIQSCLNAALPAETQFIIVDNASTDDTADVVKQLRSTCPYDLVYFKNETNRGVGGGRNVCFDLAEGEYVYFLDDDAIIAPESQQDFFISAVDFLDKHPRVASLTTQIYDEVFGSTRTEIMSNNVYEGKALAFFYLGGSHFLRKSAFDAPLYFDIKYGAEEYAPSIRAFNNGFLHVYDKDIAIIHKPKINKWVDGTDKMRDIQIRGAAVVYATKKILYPRIFLPVLWAGYYRRCQKHLKAYPGAKKEANRMVREICKQNQTNKIRIKTVISLYKMFGLTVF